MNTKLQGMVAGLATQVETTVGQRPYINLDNAATTPPFVSVMEAINSFAPWYSSVNRGNGLKSRLSTNALEHARDVVGRFVGANPDDHVVIFGKNTTEAINKLAYRLNLHRRDIVLISNLEHHSNDLPWRAQATVKRIALTAEGGIDKADFVAQLARYGSKIKLVAISGASNVTGHVPDIHWFAREAHQVGAHIFVDCAQLAAHRPINIRALSDPEHIDFIALSAHKMYAPFGTGALIGRKDIFARGQPEYTGGGTIKSVTPKSVDWAAPPDSEEAGSPNVVGAVAMARAIKTIERIGMDVIKDHESELVAYALHQLKTVPGLTIYGDTDPAHAASRSAVIPFAIESVPSHLIAAVLGYEWGIGVRSGCFCAQPYVMHLLGLKPREMQRVRYHILHNRRDLAPGLVRASLGLYNKTADIDALVVALKAIAGKHFKEYELDNTTGFYTPKNQTEDFSYIFEI